MWFWIYSKKYNLIYRASQDGFTANDFHSNFSDQNPNTLIILKSENGIIFGSYTEQDWTGNGYRNDPKSLLYLFLVSGSNQNRESLSSLGIT